MRILLACTDCARQFDVTGRSTGSVFRCLCGRKLTVAAARHHDAAVVRCSACGAPRGEGAPACGFCGSDFTLHERDLHTVCPSCMARVSDRARYCHHCATPLLPQPLGAPTGSSCPACREQRLTSRELSDAKVSVLECPRCAGLWLGRPAFAVVLDRARRRGRTVDDRLGPPSANPARQEGSLYRPCPECGALMHRRNYGRRSGVIVDNCTAHGFWFDANELDELLRWVGRGGETAAGRREHEARQQRERQRRLERRSAGGSGPIETEGEGLLLEALGRLLSGLLG